MFFLSALGAIAEAESDPTVEVRNAGQALVIHPFGGIDRRQLQRRTRREQPFVRALQEVADGVDVALLVGEAEPVAVEARRLALAREEVHDARGRALQLVRRPRQELRVGQQDDGPALGVIRRRRSRQRG